MDPFCYMPLIFAVNDLIQISFTLWWKRMELFIWLLIQFIKLIKSIIFYRNQPISSEMKISWKRGFQDILLMENMALILKEKKKYPFNSFFVKGSKMLTKDLQKMKILYLSLNK